MRKINPNISALENMYILVNLKYNSAFSSVNSQFSGVEPYVNASRPLLNTKITLTTKAGYSPYGSWDLFYRRCPLSDIGLENAPILDKSQYVSLVSVLKHFSEREGILYSEITTTDTLDKPPVNGITSIEIIAKENSMLYTGSSFVYLQ